MRLDDCKHVEDSERGNGDRNRNHWVQRGNSSWRIGHEEVVAGEAETRGQEHRESKHHYGGQCAGRAGEVCSSSHQSCIQETNQLLFLRFARYFEVEARILPVSEASHYCLDPEKVRENIDENTIGIFIILGSTYTGHYEPVAEISKILDDFQAKTGHDIPIHVDAASGGFVAPFVHPDVSWSFDIPRVHSIQCSGHKFGLVYPGLGWVIWRSEEYLPKALVFELHYLGGTEETYTLNFSRPAAQVVVQYYNFLMLGKEGYRNIMRNCLQNARILSKALERSGWYTCVSDIHRSKGVYSHSEPSPDALEPEHYNPGLPVVAFRLSDEFQKEYPHVKQQSISTLLRARGYIIPNYTLPPTLEKVEILRVVVRESMSADLLDQLIRDIFIVTETLMEADAVDLEAFSKARAPKIEKVLQSMGLTHRRNSWGGGGPVLRTTC